MSEELPSLPTFSARVAWAMRKKGVTQAELAQGIGVSQQAVAVMVNQGKSSKRDVEIAQYLGVPWRWLRNGVNIPDTEPLAVAQESVVVEQQLLTLTAQIIGNLMARQNMDSMTTADCAAMGIKASIMARSAMAELRPSHSAGESQ